MDFAGTDAPFDSLQVYREEWADIVERRGVAPGAAAAATTPPRSLVGLALSGGGIRSATFNLGVLQALNAAGLLEHMDYLSTVSGGGYIGGWWSAWRSRQQRPGGGTFPPIEGVETWRHFVAPPNERTVATARPWSPDPIHHVRLFSNYLTPRKGALSRDLWRAVTVSTRNLFLTWSALLPFVLIAVALVHALFLYTYGAADGAHLTLPPAEDRLRVVLGLPSIFMGVFVALSGIWLLVQRGSTSFQSFVTVSAIAALTWIFRTVFRGSGDVLSRTEWVLAAAVVGGAALRIVRIARERVGRDVLMNWLVRLQSVALVASLASLIVGGIAAYGALLINFLFFTPDAGWGQLAKDVGKWTGIATWLASAIQAARTGAPRGGGESTSTNRISALSRVLLIAAPPLTLIVLLLVASWLVDRAVHTAVHALWIPVVRYSTLVGAISMALYAFSEKRDSTTQIWAVWMPGVAVLVSAAGALLGLDSVAVLILSFTGMTLIALWRAADVLVPDRVREALPDQLRPGPARFDRAVLLVLAGCVMTFCVGAVSFAGVAIHDDIRMLLGTSTLLFTCVMLIGWTTDPNTLSLHTFYKMRLVRAFLGASNPERTRQDAEDVTESRPLDDVRLADLAKDTGPYHLINGTLNLTTGTDLIVAQRFAAPFLFSRRFCGSARTGFRRTAEYRAGSLTLGTAVAVSGAAASPVMGSQTPSTALSMLMALLNVRLGYWLPTPDKTDWKAPQARLWPFYLLREFFSHLADSGSHCYVTDGGHFDNTGVYALIERGCQTIIVTDCGADPDGVFDDLSSLVRRCRIDFGAEITFRGLEPFSHATVTDQRLAFVTGEIHYRQAHLRALGWNAEDSYNVIGTLILIKPTLWGRLETDVNRYSQQQPKFPQQPTSDQWFDEAQFESYRRLGEISGRAAAGSIRTAVVAAPAV